MTSDPPFDQTHQQPGTKTINEHILTYPNVSETYSNDSLNPPLEDAYQERNELPPRMGAIEMYAPSTTLGQPLADSYSISSAQPTSNHMSQVENGHLSHPVEFDPNEHANSVNAGIKSDSRLTTTPQNTPLESQSGHSDLTLPSTIVQHSNGQPSFTMTNQLHNGNPQQYRINPQSSAPQSNISQNVTHMQNLHPSHKQDTTLSSSFHPAGVSSMNSYDSSGNNCLSNTQAHGTYSQSNMQSGMTPETRGVTLNVLNTNFTIQIPVVFEKVEIKLFVGRLPRNFDELQLAPIFTPFGEVIETIIIRDKASGLHKGSAFVKMASLSEADAAVRALHGIKVIDQQLGPIQVKYANGEPERLGFTMDAAQAGHNLGKLFVGSLPRNITEPELRSLFENFGRVEEIVLMKDNNTGQLKGCAFVKFTFKEEAIYAIKTLHGQVKLPTCPRPLEVKFAENRRAAAAAAVITPGGGGHSFSVPPHPVILGKQQPGTAVAANLAFVAATSNDQVRTGANAARAQAGMATSMSNTSALAPSNLNPRTVNGWTEYFTADGRPYYHHTLSKVTQWTKPVDFNRVSPYVMQQNPIASPSTNFHKSSAAASSQNLNAVANIQMNQSGSSMQSSSDVSGPPGANVFVFHIPNEWGQNEVVQNFSQFGRVLSCYVATDRTTGRNKGYGFISYDDVQSAANAVMSMNGYPVGSKRLKVSIKTGEESYAAPLLNMTQQHQHQQQQQQQFPSQAAPSMMMPNPNSVAAMSATSTNAYAPMGMYHSSIGSTPSNPSSSPNPANMTNTMNAYRAAPY